MTPLGILIGRGVVSLGRKASVAEALISGLAARCKGPRPRVEPLGGSPGPRELVSGRPTVANPPTFNPRPRRWQLHVPRGAPAVFEQGDSALLPQLRTPPIRSPGGSQGSVRSCHRAFGVAGRRAVACSARLSALPRRESSACNPPGARAHPLGRDFDALQANAHRALLRRLRVHGAPRHLVLSRRAAAAVCVL